MSRSRSGSALALLSGLLVASTGPAPGQPPTGPRLEVIGTSFRVSLPDGHILTSVDLQGAVLEASDDAGRIVTIRIDSVAWDPDSPSGDIWLHRFSARDAVSGAWFEFCAPGPDGLAAGFPLAGRWTANGRHRRDPTSFSVVCTSGASGKCVRLGYGPWREAGGESLWDYHQACVRMVRADYGGNGTTHTREGTQIDIFDRLGINRPEVNPRGLSFEAAWGPEGAVCVRRTRIPEVLSLEDMERRYPHLARSAGPECSESTPALLWNRS